MKPCCFLLRLASLLKSGSGATDLSPVRKGPGSLPKTGPPHRKVRCIFLFVMSGISQLTNSAQCAPTAPMVSGPPPPPPPFGPLNTAPRPQLNAPSSLSSQSSAAIFFHLCMDQSVRRQGSSCRPAHTASHPRSVIFSSGPLPQSPRRPPYPTASTQTPKIHQNRPAATYARSRAARPIAPHPVRAQT